MRARIDRQECAIGGCFDLQQNGTYPWCAKHLARYRRHGDPLITIVPPPRTSPDGSLRQCCRCEQWKATDEFHRDSGGKRRACRACICAGARDSYRADPSRQYANSRRHRVMRRFGISVERYEQILAAQGGVCAICGRTCATGRKLAVDHDHGTGAVRGLLCGQCNMSLVRAEIPGWLDAVRAYLESGIDHRPTAAPRHTFTGP